MVKSLSATTMDDLQRSSLTYSVDQMVLVEGERSQTIPHEGFSIKIKVEILNS